MNSLLALVPRWLRRLVLPTILSTIVILSFIIVRHFQLKSRRCPRRRPKPPARPHHDDGPQQPVQGSRRLPAITRSPYPDFYVFVLGSGGHTKEMLMMMDDGFCDFANLHRRYLISSGDALSRHQVADYEDSLARLASSSTSQHGDANEPSTSTSTSTSTCGSHDIMTVSRARRVHQPFWSAPLTTLLSILDVAPALLVPRPDYARRRGAHTGAPRFPGMIFSNGPGTGFTVALAVHFMKVFYVVPEDCMRFVYIESWARISTLSLTGKMLYYLGLTDVFVTQHQEVADRYGLYNAGEMVFNSRREDDVSPPR